MTIVTLYYMSWLEDPKTRPPQAIFIISSIDPLKSL
jgi:hypothetical protein